jgi:hypothetical protein
MLRLQLIKGGGFKSEAQPLDYAVVRLDQECLSVPTVKHAGVDGRVHHRPDEFLPKFIKAALAEKLLSPRLLASPNGRDRSAKAGP